MGVQFLMYGDGPEHEDAESFITSDGDDAKPVPPAGLKSLLTPSEAKKRGSSLASSREHASSDIRHCLIMTVYMRLCYSFSFPAHASYVG
jgi:hypothetical protein